MTSGSLQLLPSSVAVQTSIKSSSSLVPITSLNRRTMGGTGAFANVSRSTWAIDGELSPANQKQIPKDKTHGFIVPSIDAEESLLLKDAHQEPSFFVRRPRSGSESLDCLAALAEHERNSMQQQQQQQQYESGTVHQLITSDSDDSAMPPPHPRRPRSVSNPEDMVIDSRNSNYNKRRCFILPAAFLEEKLAEATEAVEEAAQDPDMILKKARARILEDASESEQARGELITLPHNMAKYRENYNRYGHIGIYTKAERAAILARFHRKRAHRNWNKKIRYNCRKNLADSRLRIKGRFVKRCEQQRLAQSMADELNDHMPDVNDPEAGFCPTEDQPYRRLRRNTVT